MAARRNHALFTHFANDRVMLTGGYTEFHGAAARRCVGVERPLLAGTLRHGPGAAQRDGAAWYEPRKSAIMLGGHAGERGFRADTWLWERSNWNQLLLDQAPPPRYLHASPGLGNRDAVLLFGGVGTDGFPLGDTWIFESQNWKFLKTPAAPSARAGAASCWDAGRKRVLLFGGAADPAQAPRRFLELRRRLLVVG
jgi:hypothetical protein